MASGKSTIAQALAERLPVAAHVRGDAFRRFIVSGREPMTAPLSERARTQLALRQNLAARTAELFAADGITAIVQDLYLGADLRAMVERIRYRPLYVVVLSPTAQAIRQRERARSKSGYDSWAIEDFAARVDATPRLGLRINTSDLTVEQSVDQILRDQALAMVE